jgi:glycosyltransferase involved in cell wall biosynthesis
MKIVLVMTYFERPLQLLRTLESIRNSRHKNFEVVIVDDSSPTPLVINKYPFPITVIRTENKKWINAEPAYNTGLVYAMKKKPDIIICQNAECYHVGDVISYAQNVTNDSYITFGCFSIDKETTMHYLNLEQKILENNRPAHFDGDNGWYNHPKYRRCFYDFCMAITTKNMRIINGYDERFSLGWGWGDNYLLARIDMLGLTKEITIDPIVVHQWHYEKPTFESGKNLADNKKLFEELVVKSEIKAIHYFTEDL